MSVARGDSRGRECSSNPIRSGVWHHERTSTFDERTELALLNGRLWVPPPQSCCRWRTFCRLNGAPGSC